MKVEFPQGMIDRASKGDSFGYRVIRQMLPIHADEDRQLYVMQWAFALEAELDKAGKPASVRTLNRGRTVRILTDEEALDFNKGRFRSRLRGTVRDHVRTQNIDHSMLDADDQRRLEQEIRYQSRFIAAQLAQEAQHGMIAVEREVEHAV